MYIKSVNIKNIRSFADLSWDLQDRPCAGWHVLLGENGAGKTTLLKSISAAILGEQQASAVIGNWSSLLREGTDEGSIRISIDRDAQVDGLVAKRRVEVVGTPADSDQGEGGVFVVSRLGTADTTTVEGAPYEGVVWLQTSAAGRVIAQDAVPEDKTVNNWMLARWDRSDGWFTAGYGPFRRFTGGDPNVETLRGSDVVRHFTLFQESAALSEGIEWLKSLQFAKLEDKADVALIDELKRFINQPGFLPASVRLNDVSRRGVEFVDGSGAKVVIEDLSDGYRSVLCLTLDLIRQLSEVYPARQIFTGIRKIKVNLPGVVLIDEVDAHLHPTWQRQIGPWFREHFPMLQFIVSTHSPFVCQAAAEGSVFRLPAPGSDETPRFLAGAELGRLLYGDILDAYSTDVFGSGLTRSEKSQHYLDRLAELNVMSLAGALSERLRRERDELRAIFSSMPSVLDPSADARGRQ